MTMIAKMEQKYGIAICDDSYYDPFTMRELKRYKIYTADGCQWENNLTFRGLQAECRQHGDTFKQIAAQANKSGIWRI